MTVSQLPFEAEMQISDAGTCGSIKYMERALKAWPQASPNDGLHTACCGGWVDLVKWLLQQGASPNAKANGKSPLYWIIAGDGWELGNSNRANEPDEYKRLLKIMLEYGMRLDENEIYLASQEKNNNYSYLKPILDEYSQKQ